MYPLVRLAMFCKAGKANIVTDKDHEQTTQINQATLKMGSLVEYIDINTLARLARNCRPFGDRSHSHPQYPHWKTQRNYGPANSSA